MDYSKVKKMNIEAHDNVDIDEDDEDMMYIACAKFVDYYDGLTSLLVDAEKLLYPYCTIFNKLSSLVQLCNLKSKYDFFLKKKLLKLVHEMLPSDNILLVSI